MFFNLPVLGTYLISCWLISCFLFLHIPSKFLTFFPRNEIIIYPTLYHCFPQIWSFRLGSTVTIISRQQTWYRVGKLILINHHEVLKDRAKGSFCLYSLLNMSSSDDDMPLAMGPKGSKSHGLSNGMISIYFFCHVLLFNSTVLI